MKIATFTMKIHTTNDAFAANPDELAQCVQNVAERLREGKREGTVKDSNGNTVGSWKV